MFAAVRGRWETVNDEILWYVSRVSGLMAWILAFGALTAGLLARSGPAADTSAGLWASDTRTLLGRTAAVAVLVHWFSIGAAPSFAIDPVAGLTARQDGSWMAPAIVVGVFSAWALVVVEAARLVLRRLPEFVDLVLLTGSALIVAGGAVHGWRLGSDTNNPYAMIVVVFCGLVLLGAAAIGLTRSSDDSGDGGLVTPSNGASSQPDGFTIGVGPDEANQPVSASSIFDRGPELASAPDVGRRLDQGQGPVAEEFGEEPTSQQFTDTLSGSWSMFRLSPPAGGESPDDGPDRSTNER